jgi:hypothetical protein
MKARSDSLKAKLSEPQLDELFQNLQSGLSYQDAAAWLLSQHKIKASVSAVCNCYARWSFSWQLERAKAAAQAVEKAPTFEAEKARLLSQKIFEAVAQADVPPKVLIALRSLELEADKVKLAERRVKVIEQKVEEVREKLNKAKKAKGGVSKKTLEEIEQSLNLL